MPTNKELAKMVEEQNKKIDDLVEMMGMVVAELPKKNVPNVPIEVVKAVDLPPQIDSKLPPPIKWRQKVNEILGEEFGLGVDESSGGNYLITILIPDKYDRRKGEKQGKDISTGLVRRASDMADVEKWCNLIKATIVREYPDFKK